MYFMLFFCTIFFPPKILQFSFFLYVDNFLRFVLILLIYLQIIGEALLQVELPGVIIVPRRKAGSCDPRSRVHRRGGVRVEYHSR